MAIDNDKKRPWLDKNGNPLSSKELKDVTKDWGPTQWEEYLQTIEYHPTELPSKFYEALRTKHDKYEARDAFLQELAIENEEEIAEIVQQAKEEIFYLPFDQQFVIKSLFFDGLKTRQVGEKLKISHTQVLRLKKKALSVIREQLVKRKPNSK